MYDVDIQEHLTEPQILAMDIRRAAWLAARMLRDAADAPEGLTPAKRQTLFPSKSLLDGLVRWHPSSVIQHYNFIPAVVLQGLKFMRMRSRRCDGASANSRTAVPAAQSTLRLPPRLRCRAWHIPDWRGWRQRRCL